MSRSTPPRPLEDRPFDVVVFGATGFTGRLVAEYFAGHAAESGVRWAIAGRNKDKLEALRRDLAAKDQSLVDLPIVNADSHDVAALDRLVPTTRVICTTVGPYAKYGLDLVRACAGHGTSYCDITAEPNFVRAVIDECHGVARSTRARLVTCAGFDSVPSDLGVYMLWNHVNRRHGEGLSWAKTFTGDFAGGLSGGTFASGLAIVEAAVASREVRRLLFDPHALDPRPPSGARDPFEDDQRGVRFDKDIDRWTGPFIMEWINTRIVRRSNALLREEGDGYGQHFLYNEAMRFGPGVRGLAPSALAAAVMNGFIAAAIFPATRRLLERMAPAPGEGPARELIEKGFFEMLLLARAESGALLRARVAGRDPGYGETAKMLAESAMCLAKDGERLTPRFGVLTPATAMGMRLVERLRNAGLTFEVLDSEASTRTTDSRDERKRKTGRQEGEGRSDG